MKIVRVAKNTLYFLATNMTDQMKPANEIQEMRPVNLPADSAYVQRAEERALAFANPKLWQQIKVMAESFRMSGALPQSLDTVPKVVMVLQAGYEAGMQPIEAINSFYFVNGKISIYGEMAITQVLRAGHKVDWGKCDAESATVTITRGDTGASMTTTFTMKMAQERGLTKNPNYQKFPENMLRFKAFHATSRFVCPDAFHGLPIKEVEEAETIKAEAIDVDSPDGTPAIHVEAPTRGKRKSLRDAIKEPEAKQEAEAEPTFENLTDDEKYTVLMDKELAGGKLTPKEKMFIGQHQAKQKV